MNPTSYCLTMSMATCSIASAVIYTMDVIAELSSVKNCHTMLAIGVLPATLIFYCNF